MTRLAVSLLITLTAAVAPGAARAAGFLIYDLGGEALGRASAVTADTTGPSAVWFNPAGLTFLGDRAAAEVGGVFITARSRFSPADGGADTSSQRGNFFLPALYASSRINDRVAVGMGVYTAFGIGIEWPNAWDGRENAIKASLKTVAFNPTVAVKLLPNLSLAAGFDAVRGTVDFIIGLPELVGGQVRLGGGTWGYGFNAAAMYRIVPDQWHLGLTYRSRVTLDFDGQADFDPANPDFSPMLPDQPGSASITLPDIITAGVMYRPRSDLTLTFDVNLVLWSTYSRIDIAFQNAPGRSLQPDAKDSLTVRAGAAYATRVPGLQVRAGFIYDRAAVTNEGLGPGLPDGHRLDFAAGVGYARGPFRGDLGYMLVYFLPADAVGRREGPEGTYNTLANLLALSIGASWR
jgi:long-chain fatty acid transport protein